MLLLSLITLFAGPLMFQWLKRSHGIAHTVDRIIVVVLIVVVAVLLLPEIVASLGPLALVLVLGGFLLPGLLEGLVRRAAETLHLFTLYLALAGLLVHAALDGAGLATADLQADAGFAAAIVLHRFGMGLMLWLIVQPVLGARRGWTLLIAMAAATVLGYAFSEPLVPLAGQDLVTGFQALILGTIVHGLVFRGHVHRDEPTGNHS